MGVTVAEGCGERRLGPPCKHKADGSHRINAIITMRESLRTVDFSLPPPPLTLTLSLSLHLAAQEACELPQRQAKETHDKSKSNNNTSILDIAASKVIELPTC